MSNYLKKLAYVHEAMKKMAIKGPNMGNTEGMKVSMPAAPITPPPKPPEKVKPGVTKPVASTSATGITNTLNDDQRWQNVVNYQRELVNRMVATGRFGVGPEAKRRAEEHLRSKGRWYDTRGDLSQYSGKRFNSIANGTRGYMKVNGEQAPYNAFSGYAASNGKRITKPPVRGGVKAPKSTARSTQGPTPVSIATPNFDSTAQPEYGMSMPYYGTVNYGMDPNPWTAGPKPTRIFDFSEINADKSEPKPVSRYAPSSGMEYSILEPEEDEFTLSVP